MQTTSIKTLRTAIFNAIEKLHQKLYTGQTAIKVLLDNLTESNDESAILNLAFFFEDLNTTPESDYFPSTEENTDILNLLKGIIKEYYKTTPMTKGIEEIETYTSVQLNAKCYKDQIHCFTTIITTDSSIYLTLVSYPQ